MVKDIKNKKYLIRILLNVFLINNNMIYNYVKDIYCLSFSSPALINFWKFSKVIFPVLLGSKSCLYFCFSSSVGSLFRFKACCIFFPASAKTSNVTAPSPLVSILAQSSFNFASNLDGSLASAFTLYIKNKK